MCPSLEVRSELFVGLLGQINIIPNKQMIGVLLAEHFGDIVAAEPLTRIIKQKHPDSISILDCS